MMSEYDIHIFLKHTILKEFLKEIQIFRSFEIPYFNILTRPAFNVSHKVVQNNELIIT